VKLPYAVAYAAGVITTAWAQVSGKPPRAPIDAVKMAKKKMFVSHAKAAAELGFQPGKVEFAMQRAIDWFQQNGYC
jgi:dihydroflavonol-4-reductase